MNRDDEDRYWELGQMLGCTMSEDDYENYATEQEAVASWIAEIGLHRCPAMLVEIKHLYAGTATALERRNKFRAGLGFLQADGSNFDPLMAYVEVLVRDRIARES